jgi:hypothetical protein
MPNLETYQSVDLAPGWLRDAWGTAFLGAFGKRKDAHVALLKEAVKARFPSYGSADALALLAQERGIVRGQTETEASHRARVKAAWEAWLWAGTSYGMLTAFYWAGYYTPTAGKVVLQTQKGKQYELRSDFDPTVHTPENALVYTDLGTVHLGGSPELWSQFGVFFVPPLPAGWSPAPPADGAAEMDAIRALIVAWKPGHMRCVRLQASTGPIVGWPGLLVGGFTVGGEITTYTPPAA